MDEQSIFLEALQKETPEELAAFLAEACGDDEAIRHEIEMLLKAHNKVGDFLQGAPAGFENTLDQPITEKPGTQIGPYKLLQKVGEGGMGVVYMAEQKEPVKRRVALKIIKPGMDTRQVIARFEAERQALAMMDHPNIAKVLDAGATESGRPYFVMELVNGVSITQYCDEQHLTPKERLELFVPICQAVQHAHQKGIIHRDLKPSNILVAEYDHRAVPKIIDFGVAKATSQTLTEKTMFTQLGQIVGTLEYMSPEQAKRNQLDVDTRSDIYSLGVLLYELLTGETPFDRERLRSAAFDEMLRIIREEEPSKPSTKVISSQSLPSIAANRRIEPAKLSSMIRGELDWIVLKAMEKDRGRRYETASKFAEDVQHYLNDEAVVACPPSRAYKFRKFARRNKAALGTATVVAASLVFGIVGTSWQAYRAKEAERVAEDRLTLVESQKQKIEEERQRAIAEAQRADGAAEDARSASQIAEAVRTFLQEDLLGMATVDNQILSEVDPDPDISLLTVVDRAADRIEGRFTNPVVEAEIRETIAKVYASLGEQEKAEQHFDRALKLRESLEAGDLVKLLDTASSLGLTYLNQGIEAKPDGLQYTQALYKRCVDSLGVDHRTTLGVKRLLGLYRFRESHDSEDLYEVIRAYENALGNAAYNTCLIKSDLAWSLCSYSKYAPEAAELSRQVLQDAPWPERFPLRIRTKRILGIALRMSRDFEQSEQVLRDALSLSREVWGVNHPETLPFEGALAKTLKGQKRFQEAEELVRTAYDARLRQLGPEHRSTLDCQVLLAEIAEGQGRSAESISIYRDVLKLDPERFSIRIKLVEALRDSPQEQQEQLIELENACPDKVNAHNDIALLYQKLKQWDLAEKHYLRSIELRPDLGADKYNLAQLYVWKGESRRALQLMDDWGEEFLPIRLQIFMRLNRWDDAVALCQKLMKEPKIKPFQANSVAVSCSNTSWWLSTSHEADHYDPQVAVDVAEFAAKLEPGIANHFDNLGVALYRNGRFTDAIASLMKARVMSAGDDPLHRIFLVLSYWKSGQEEKALAEYVQNEVWMQEKQRDSIHVRFRNEAEKLIGRDRLLMRIEAEIVVQPDSIALQVARLALLARSGRDEQVAAQGLALLNIPQLEDMHRNGVYHALVASDRTFEEAIQNRSNDLRLWFERGDFLCRQERWIQAAEAFEQSQNAELAARTQLIGGEMQKYLEWCRRRRKAIQQQESVIGAHLRNFVESCSFSGKAELDRAQLVRMAERAHSELQNASSIRVLGHALYRNGEYQRAIDTYQQGIDNHGVPLNSVAFPLALAHHKLGTVPAAQELYNLGRRYFQEGTAEASMAKTFALTHWLSLNAWYREARCVFEPDANREEAESTSSENLEQWNSLGVANSQEKNAEIGEIDRHN